MMAATTKRLKSLLLFFKVKSNQCSRSIRTSTVTVGTLVSTACIGYSYYKWKIQDSNVSWLDIHGLYAGEVHAKEILEGPPKPVAVTRTLSSREQRFQLFSSYEYGGQMYMSPQDFLESVTQQDPRARIGRTKLDVNDVEKMLKQTPGRRWGSSPKLFRDLHADGIISYTEYLFLLCVITKPHSGFQIAFNMFDTDGNRRVDKNEFLVIRGMLTGLKVKRVLSYLVDQGYLDATQQPTEGQITDMLGGYGLPLQEGSRSKKGSELERVFMNTDEQEETRIGVHVDDDDDDDDGEASEKEKEPVDTTLLIHLFGHKGNLTLKYEDFYKFMDNLQTEVLEIEFHEFSKGMKTISEEEFARILLRYTKLSQDEQHLYLDRLRKRIPVEKGITFQEFQQFCQFLNNIDDFVIAMRIYTLSDHPVTQSEFQRAVKISTGCNLNDHLVHTVFQVFDKDGDGNLSYREFLAIMKDRIHRGFRTENIQTQGWGAFKHCVKHVLRNT